MRPQAGRFSEWYLIGGAEGWSRQRGLEGLGGQEAGRESLSLEDVEVRSKMQWACGRGKRKGRFLDPQGGKEANRAGRVVSCSFH